VVLEPLEPSESELDEEELSSEDDSIHFVDDVLRGRLVHVRVGLELEEKVHSIDQEEDLKILAG
jgi:hypothetical protein